MRSMLLPLLAAFTITQVRAADTGQAWVEMAPGGGSVVRALTMAGVCPVIQVDGQPKAMTERAAPARLPARTNKAHVATPLSFPTHVCEIHLSRRTRRARLGGHALAVPKARIDRIVLIGDTGCRLKSADKAWQGCNDAAQWPFAAIAARAAALHPDLVLHVGDYLYRENPCPADRQSCADTAWGYGEDGWRADFLAPAAPLLGVAPWVMVRGNHEECARAGQGWWRLLDPHALRTGGDCLDPANDASGDHTDPYAVSLGGGAQIVVADLMELASGKPGDAGVTATVARDMARIARLSHGAKDSFVTAHFPFNPVLWDEKRSGAVAIGSKPVNAFTVPPLGHVRAMIAGHVHLFQYARFADRPTQIITGFSGTMEDDPVVPGSLAAIAGKPGSPSVTALRTIIGRFGYALLERRAHGWRLAAFAADGTRLGLFPL